MSSQKFQFFINQLSRFCVSRAITHNSLWGRIWWLSVCFCPLGVIVQAQMNSICTALCQSLMKLYFDKSCITSYLNGHDCWVLSPSISCQLTMICLCLSWTQAAEVGWERETGHRATEEENWERGTENDEKRAEDRCQTFITLIQRTGHSKQQPNNCSYYIWPCFVLPSTLLSSTLWDIFF